MKGRLLPITILLVITLFTGYLPQMASSALETFPEEFASEIVHRSQTPLTGALAITDLDSDSRRELVFADWNGGVFLMEEGGEAGVVFREEPDQEGENPVMGVEQPGGNFTSENQVMIYGYSGAVRVLTFNEDLEVVNAETVFVWEEELFTMARGDLLVNVSGEELYFGDWKTPHIIVLWKDGDLWEHLILNTSAPVKSLLYTDFDPAVPGGELYATLDNPQNSTLVEIWTNASGHLMQRDLLSDRFLLTNVKEANLLEEDGGVELVVTSLSGRAYHLRHENGAIRVEVIYDTEGGGGLEGLSTGRLDLNGGVNVTVMTGYSNILALGLEVEGGIETRVVWSSPNIKEFELAGVLIGDFDSQIEGNEIYVTAYTGYIAEIYYAEGRLHLEILDEDYEPVEGLVLYPGYFSNYLLVATTYTAGSLSVRIIIEGGSGSVYEWDAGSYYTAPNGPLYIPAYIRLSPDTPAGNYTFYVFINYSANSFVFTFPAQVKRAEVEELTVEPEEVDIDLLLDDPDEVEVTFTLTSRPFYEFLYPSVAAGEAPGALNWTVDTRSSSVRITFTLNRSGEIAALRGTYTYTFLITMGNITREAVVNAHLFSLNETLQVRVRGMRPGSTYILLEANLTRPIHSEIRLFAGMKRGEVGGGPYEPFTLKGDGGDVLLAFPEPLKEGEEVEVFIYTPRGVTVYDMKVVVSGGDSGEGGENFVIFPVIALIAIAAVAGAGYFWRKSGRAETGMEE